MVYKKSQFSNISSFTKLRASVRMPLSPLIRRSSVNFQDVGQLQGPDLGGFTNSLSRLYGRNVVSHAVGSRNDTNDPGFWAAALQNGADKLIEQMIMRGQSGNPTQGQRRRQPSRNQGMADIAQLIRRAMERNG